MTQKKFTVPPILSRTLTPEEKERKAESFLNFMDVRARESVVSTERKIEKEVTKGFAFRIPETLFDDLREISNLTGISINSICLELIRPSIKKKLKDLKEGT